MLCEKQTEILFIGVFSRENINFEMFLCAEQLIYNAIKELVT